MREVLHCTLMHVSIVDWVLLKSKESCFMLLSFVPNLYEFLLSIYSICTAVESLGSVIFYHNISFSNIITL